MDAFVDMDIAELELLMEQQGIVPEVTPYGGEAIPTPELFLSHGGSDAYTNNFDALEEAWLDAVLVPDTATPDDKSTAVFTEDDDIDPGIVTTGTIGPTATFGPLPLATYDGDGYYGDPNGPGGENYEVITVGERQTPPEMYILRGPDGSDTFTYHFDGDSYTNESDWLNAIIAWILQVLEDETIIGADTPTIPIAPGLEIEALELLPANLRRAIIEFLCGCRLPSVD